MKNPSFLIISLLLCIDTLSAQALYFPPNGGDTWAQVDNREASWNEDGFVALDQFLEESNTKGIIVLHKGKILHEKYFNGHDASKAWYWASAGKSLTAFLTGMAAQEGFLDIDDSTSMYLGQGWTSCSSDDQEKITIRHQLTMTTGLDIGQPLDCTDAACLLCDYDPGTFWYYHNAPYTLIESVVSNAVGTTYNQYTNQKLAPTGIAGLWIKNGFNNVFYSTLRNFARFGLLMQAGGSWDGTPILSDTSYYRAMITPSQDLNRSYGYLWWLNGQTSHRLPGIDFEFSGPLMPDAPTDAYAALGKNSQILLIIPSLDLVIARMGDDPQSGFIGLTYANELRDVFSQVFKATSTKENPNLAKTVEVKGNRVTFNLKGSYQIQVFDVSGTMLQSLEVTDAYELKNIQPGIYFIHIQKDSESITIKVPVIR